MAPIVFTFKLEMKLAGDAGAWTDVTADVYATDPII